MLCVVCQTGTLFPKYTIKRFEPHFLVSECYSCGCLMQDPMPENPDLFYDADYYEGKAQFHYLDERKKRKSSRICFSFANKKYQKKNKIRQVFRCWLRFWAFTRAASAVYQSAGLDVSLWAVQQAEKHYDHTEKYAGVFHGSLLNLPDNTFFTPKSLDVITLIEVAEHLSQPRKNFLAAYNLLAPGGLLLIQTANFEGLQAESEGENYHYFLPGHLVYYRATALKKMLSEIGFGNFEEYFPVDFSLWAKIRKSVAGFRNFADVYKIMENNQISYDVKTIQKRKTKDFIICFIRI